MPKRRILKQVYFLITAPLIFIGSLLLKFNLFQFRGKLDICIRLVDQKCSEIPDSYISYLVAAEDHRSSFHYGVDQIGVLRALYKKFFSSEIQGASTIEQQFTRVAIGDYSYTLQRKIKEQLLAVLLTKNRNKTDIAKAYLAIAYYGHDSEGITGITNLVGSELTLASENQIISIVARLKYPKPTSNIGKWKELINKRKSYIKSRHEKDANKLRQRVLRTAACGVNYKKSPAKAGLSGVNKH